jgi:hypothetical protein
MVRHERGQKEVAMDLSQVHSFDYANSRTLKAI